MVRGFSRAHRAERLGQWLAIRSAKTSSDTSNTASVVGKSTNATCQYNVPTPPIGGDHLMQQRLELEFRLHVEAVLALC